MRNLLNQIRDIVRNSFDRFLCALPVIGDALRLVRILYQLVREQKTASEAMLTHVCEIGNEVTGVRLTIEAMQDDDDVLDNLGEPVTVAVLYELVREHYDRIEQIQRDRITDSLAIRKELNERINRCSLARADQAAFDEIVRRLNALETVQRVPEPTVEKLNSDFALWTRTSCQPTK